MKTNRNFDVYNLVLPGPNKGGISCDLAWTTRLVFVVIAVGLQLASFFLARIRATCASCTGVVIEPDWGK
jgi:hypothetical protein